MDSWWWFARWPAFRVSAFLATCVSLPYKRVWDSQWWWAHIAWATSGVGLLVGNQDVKCKKKKWLFRVLLWAKHGYNKHVQVDRASMFNQYEVCGFRFHITAVFLFVQVCAACRLWRLQSNGEFTQNMQMIRWRLCLGEWKTHRTDCGKKLPKRKQGWANSNKAQPFLQFFVFWFVQLFAKAKTLVLRVSKWNPSLRLFHFTVEPSKHWTWVNLLSFCHNIIQHDGRSN